MSSGYFLLLYCVVNASCCCCGVCSRRGWQSGPGSLRSATLCVFLIRWVAPQSPAGSHLVLRSPGFPRPTRMLPLPSPTVLLLYEGGATSQEEAKVRSSYV